MKVSDSCRLLGRVRMLRTQLAGDLPRATVTTWPCLLGAWLQTPKAVSAPRHSRLPFSLCLDPFLSGLFTWLRKVIYLTTSHPGCTMQQCYVNSCLNTPLSLTVPLTLDLGLITEVRLTCLSEPSEYLWLMCSIR